MKSKEGNKEKSTETGNKENYRGVVIIEEWKPLSAKYFENEHMIAKIDSRVFPAETTQSMQCRNTCRILNILISFCLCQHKVLFELDMPVLKYICQVWYYNIKRYLSKAIVRIPKRALMQK